MAVSSIGKIFGAILSIALVVAVSVFLVPALTVAVGAFLASAIGAVVVALGLAAINSVFSPSGKGAAMEAGSVTVRLAESPRWLNAGLFRQGGTVLFAEFDGSGNLWVVTVHSDSIAHGPYQYFLDDLPVTLSGSTVTNKEFRLKNNKEKDAATTDGEGTGYVDLWTTTYSETDPTPPPVAALSAALGSKWTADHKLVGTTFTVMRMKAIDVEHRYKIYKWRGPLGLGDPGVSVACEWSNVYDPRDETQTLGDRTTYKPTRNAALIWAWFRTHPFGRNKPETSINWSKVAEQADICDQSVVGVESTQPRYECGIAIPDNKRRVIAEQEIMLTMDAQIVFDDDGKTWVRCGHWYNPTLALHRNRDIMAMESVEATNGESETQGVIVRYTDALTNFTVQPSAAWINPLYYDPEQSPSFLVIDIPAIQNHNQAMRVAKGIGLRSQPPHKIAPTAGLRGLRARQERIINLNYDNTFAGDYEIATQVEVDPNGILVGFGAVPIDSDRWTLLAGEEKPRPVNLDSRDSVTVSNVGVIVGPSYNQGRIVGTVDVPARDDARLEARYARTADSGDDTAFIPMDVNQATGEIRSDVITATDEYTVQYRVVTSGGVATEWDDATVNASAYSNLSQAIFNSWIVEESSGVPVVTVDSVGDVTIDDHNRQYPDGFGPVFVSGTVLNSGLAPGETGFIGYDDPTRSGGTVTYIIYDVDPDARVSASHPYRHFVGYFRVPATGSGTGGGGGYPGGGGNGTYIP